MKLSYRYRLYPTKAQSERLDFLRRQACDLYNAGLQERREAYRMCHVSLNYYDQANQLKAIRKDSPDGIGMLNFSACQQTLRRVNKSFAAFFRRVAEYKRLKALGLKAPKPGYPRFKPYHRFESLEFSFGDGAYLKDNRLVIQNIGPVKVKWHRSLPADSTVKAVVVSHAGDDKWYACFQLECPDAPVPEHAGPSVGIDLGVSTLAALSTGECITAPQYFRHAAKELRRKQRHLARCKKGSERRKEARQLVAKVHTQIANRRRDFAHKLSTRLVKEFAFIAVEDLNIDALCQSMFSKSIHDVGWSQLLSLLQSKASSAGSRIVRVDPYNTSQACSGCGSIVKKKLSVRVHSCPHCGLVLDRDVNAALNILHLALTSAGTLPSAVKTEFVVSYLG